MTHPLADGGDTGRSSRSGSPRSSIFGDIDVAKLNGARSSGLRSSMPSSANSSIRGMDEDDEESLFGKVRTKRVATPSAPSPPPPASPPTKTKVPVPSPSALPSAPTPVRHSPAPSPSPPSAAEVPAAVSTPTTTATPTPPSPPPPATAPPSIGPSDNKEEPPATPPARPSSSIFASASRFIKIRTKSAKTEPDTPAHEPKTSILPQPQIPSSQPVMSTQNSPIPASPQKRFSRRELVKKKEEEVRQKEKEKEEEEQESLPTPVIEDEATRAFASDLMRFRVDRLPGRIDYADSPELQASLTKDTLQLNQPVLTPSASTPTTATMNHESLNPWSETPLGFGLEPSVTSSTPLKGQRPLNRRQIAPTKRDAFADLISSWNGERMEIVREEKEEDRELFLDTVAAERRDIGFAGISNEEEAPKTPKKPFVDFQALSLDDPWC
ncbi:hypothetical protein EC973_004898 [Apophysomyces ossiformis]|uniref:Uncharacterized protein n=1 Tax=Apophysomyces ossiformis TaxID=679940 RepID=A0A8H7BSE2_9FUNG|nr:hypothetical protein EC973_004898 [Apophysomyces ossiformis]